MEAHGDTHAWRYMVPCTGLASQDAGRELTRRMHDVIDAGFNKVYVTEPFPRGLPQAPCVCVAVALELVNVFRGEICRIILAQDLDQSVSDPFRHLWPQDGEIRSRLNQRDIPVP